MRFSTTVVVTSLAAAGTLRAQPGPDTLGALAAAKAHVRELSRLAPDSIWPGFRPDTIPLVFVLPGRGAVLYGWRGAPPDGFAEVPGAFGALWAAEAAQGAASTSTTLSGRRAAQVVVDSLEPAGLAALAMHEAFHAFARASARPGRRFGGAENAALTSRYPVFEVREEADFALEARLLDEALAARAPAERRRLVHQFLAVREARQRRIGDDFAQFERMAEINEGLAEYALVRTLSLLARSPDSTTARQARERLARHRARLRTVTDDLSRSVRLRFYATGPAIALLLDRGAGPAWKSRMMEENLSLQDALAQESGYREAETVLSRLAAERHGLDALRVHAAGTVERLRALRLAQRDSVLSRPGVQLVVDASGMAQRDVGICGFDPQNTFRVSPTVELHMRWLRPCNTNTTFGEFNTPVVHDAAAGTLTAVVGEESTLQVTIAGAPVRLADGERREGEDIHVITPAATYQAGRGILERRGRVLRLALLPPP
ncbi:MAG TPA: hypothetical protein VHG08_07490 [Longimicrobium sp.]|nr:hypothetical protein [Longimicrobium sp.]